MPNKNMLPLIPLTNEQKAVLDQYDRVIAADWRDRTLREQIEKEKAATEAAAFNREPE